MLFNSIEFLFFLPIVFAIYWLLWKNYKWQNVALLLASYVFYAWWDYRFLLLLVGLSIAAYGSGILIERSRKLKVEGGMWKVEAKFWTIVNIVLDLGVLAVFKYYNFFVSSFAELFGLQNSIHSLKIVLPLGISFFTFQAIAYVIDVYKRKIEPTNLVDCLLYIGFFPKLLSGPIERPTNLMPQIQKEREFNAALASDGIRQMLWGLFKKVVIADNCASYVNHVWENVAGQTGSTLLFAAILYTFQIYCDFSGYSDMAIGTAKLFGFRFRDNFLFPYFSRNMNEFWRRWHISLNTWFVDYVYIPLGGSRNGKWKTIRNTMIIFLLSGLWHGANWTFIGWGAYHGLLLVLLILMNRNRKYNEVVAKGRMLPTLKELGQMGLVFGLATIGWVLFRATGMKSTIKYLLGICSPSLFSIPYVGPYDMLAILLPIAIMLVVEWLQRDKQHGLDLTGLKWYVRYPIYVVMVGLIIYFWGSAQSFIYFQF